MKNKFFTHRFLPILSVFLFALFVSFTNVKASDVSYDDLTFTIPDNIENYLLGNYESGGYLLLVPNSENAVFKITGDTESVIGITCYTDTTFSTLCPFDSYYLPSGTNFNSAYLTKNVTDNRTFKKSSAFYYSDFDVLYSDGTVFFQKPLLGITEALVVETNKAQIAEQLKKIITGFLKYLIALVISVIAFWKGWQFLLTQLKKA